jgi:hypothetical protein
LIVRLITGIYASLSFSRSGGFDPWCRIKIERNKESLKNVQHNKIENIAGSV